MTCEVASRVIFVPFDCTASGALNIAVSAGSLSLTVSVVVALTNPVAVAVMVTVAVPSAVLLSIAAIVAVAVV